MKTIREIAAWAMLCLVFCSFSTDEKTVIAYPIIEVHPQTDGDVQMMVNVPRRGNDTIVSLPIYRFNETDIAGNFLKMLTDTISHDYKYNAQRLYIPDEYNTSNFTLESAFGLDELGQCQLCRSCVDKQQQTDITLPAHAFSDDSRDRQISREDC